MAVGDSTNEDDPQIERKWTWDPLDGWTYGGWPYPLLAMMIVFLWTCRPVTWSISRPMVP